MPYVPGTNLFFVPPHLQNERVRPHLQLLTKAYESFLRPAFGISKTNTDQERVFHELYQEIRAHEDFWFNEIFVAAAGVEFSEWTVGILGTLATVRRQRGDTAKCLEVLELDERVLARYDSIVDHDHPEAEGCFRNLRYKFHMIGSNVHQSLRQKEECLKHFREAARYEIEEGFSWVEQKYAFLLSPLGEDYMSVQFLNDTSDDFIWGKLMEALNLEPKPRSEVPAAFRGLKVEPWLCDFCGTEEEMCGDFMRCGACKHAYYCNKECQVSHWKMHKPDCKNKGPKTSVSMKEMKDSAKSLTAKYADMVEEITIAPPSEAQQKGFFRHCPILEEVLTSPQRI